MILIVQAAGLKQNGIMGPEGHASCAWPGFASLPGFAPRNDICLEQISIEIVFNFNAGAPLTPRKNVVFPGFGCG